MPNQRNVDSYFNKCFEFSHNERWVLPTEAYKTPPWQIEALQQMKVELNKVKGQLSNFDLEKWSIHTRQRDPSSSIIASLKGKANIELLTQAWCKFYECLCRYAVIPEVAIYEQEFRSLHLCEAPGAFVSALNRYLYTHHRKMKWQWLASTLNPYYEGNPASDMIADDRLIRHTLEHWEFGVDFTGDLTKHYNHKVFVEKGPFELVTADGSVDCMKDPGEQESNVHFLHYCEAITALRVLRKQGTLVLKIFTMFEHHTVSLVYLLSCCFAKVYVFKPCSSKSGNSEVYLICLEYKGFEILADLWPLLVMPYRGLVETEKTAMFSIEQICFEFLQQLEDCNQFFMCLQCRTINDNIRHFTNQAHSSSEEVESLKAGIAERYIKKYRFAFHIPKRHRLFLNYERARVKPFASDDWDTRVINVADMPLCDVSIKPKVGRALITVTSSKFCSLKVSFAQYSFKNLIESVKPSLPPSYVTIYGEKLSDQPQYVQQRAFFNSVMNGVEQYMHMVLVGVPLLTRFLVGLIYVLAQGFETILVYKKGLLLLRNPQRDKILMVQKQLSFVKSIYEHIDSETRFDADILEVVPEELFEHGCFYETICEYNNQLFGAT